jgi:High potential iron-sulfur protein
MVDAKDAQAVALGYVAEASQADTAKFKTYVAGQACGNCSLFGGKAGDAAGACPIFAGKQVSVKGWCSAYVKKAA